MFTGADGASGMDNSAICMATSDWAVTTAAGMSAAAIGTATSDRDVASEEASAYAAARLDGAFLMEVPSMRWRLFSRPGEDLLALPP